MESSNFRIISIFPIIPIAVCALIIYLSSFHRRRQLPPGPIGIPIAGYLPFLSPDLHSSFARLSSLYGPIFSLRLGSKLAVVISSPSLSRQILRDDDAAFSSRDVPAVARIISYGGSDIVWNDNVREWRMLRKLCTQGLLGPAARDSGYAVRRCEIRASIRKIYAAGVAGEAVDVGGEMFAAVMNIVTGMLWGKRTVGAKEFREIVGEVTELLGLPNVSDFFPVLGRLDLQGVERKMKDLLRRFDSFFEKIIETKRSRRREEKEEEEDFLDRMLLLADKGDTAEGIDTPFTMNHVKAVLMDMVVGGTDTTSNTIEFAMAELMKNPETMKLAQEELDRVVGRAAAVEESHLSHLHYLSMVVKEVLRLHPPLPLMVPHCPRSACTVAGYNIPEASRVFINIWAIHRDPSLWKDPSNFVPKRFADSAPASHEFIYLPFGYGRRICLGMSMADRMVTYYLASLIHSFNWRLPNGDARLDLSEKFGIVLKKAEPLVAVPVPRLTKPEAYY